MADVLRSPLIVTRREPGPFLRVFVDPPLNLVIGLAAALPIGLAALTLQPQHPSQLRLNSNTSAGSPLALLTPAQAPVVSNSTAGAPDRVRGANPDTSRSAYATLFPPAAATDPFVSARVQSAPHQPRTLFDSTRGTPKTLTADAQLPVGAKQTTSIPVLKSPRNWLNPDTSARVPAAVLVPLLPPPVGTVLTTSIPINRTKGNFLSPNTATGTSPIILDNPGPTPVVPVVVQRLGQVAVPNLPLAGPLYAVADEERFRRVLRLYFNALNHVVNSVISASGGAFLSYPYGEFVETSDQTIASTTTAYPVLIGTEIYSNGVSQASTSEVEIVTAGYYSFRYYLQFSNTSATAYKASAWFTKNGSNVAESAQTFSVPGTHGGNNGRLLVAMEYNLSLVPDDLVQLQWCGDNVALLLEAVPTGASPTRPRSPSAKLAVNLISRTV